MYAGGRIPDVPDSMLLQEVGEIELPGIARVFRPAAQKQQLQLPVDIVGMIEKAGEMLVELELGVAHQARAELAHPREFVEVLQAHREGLPSAHREPRDGPILASR